MSELAVEIADLLHRPTGGAGYAVLRSSVRAELDWLREFQVFLIGAVWNAMSARRVLNYCSESVRLNQFEAVDGHLPREIVGDVTTFKRLHFDPHSVVFAHLYEPPVNLVGGSISLVDVDRYLRDEGCEMSDAFEPLHEPGHDGRLVARDGHRERMLNDYSTTVDPPSSGEYLLLLVRNDPIAGVAHEVAEVRAIDAKMPTIRRFYRTSIAPHH